MSDSIDTEIPGSTESVHSAADWLFTLRDDISGADELFGSCRKKAESSFSGQVSLAVETYCRRLENASQDTFERAKKAADVTRAFADQLGWRQEDMADHRGRAVDGGLTVSGYDAYVEKQELFDELREDVDHTFNELSSWIDDNLATTESDVLASRLIAAVKTVVIETAKGTATRLTENHFAARAQALRDAAVKVAREKAGARSGNYGVNPRKGPTPRKGVPQRSTTLEPSAAAVQNNLNRSPKLSGLMDKADDMVRRAGTAIKTFNVATTLGSIGAELASGESPGTVLVRAGAAVAGAAATGAGIATVVGTSTALFPVVGTAAAVAAGSVIVAESAGYVYEHTVPLHVRDRIDEGLRDAKDAVADGLRRFGEGLAHGGGRFN